MNFWNAIQVGGIIMGWLQRASIDGVITVNELVSLITQIIGVLGLEDKLRIEVPEPRQDTMANPVNGPDPERLFYKSLVDEAKMRNDGAP